MTEKILKLVQEKGYRPNMLVRGVLSGRTKTIGVVIPASDFFSEIIHGIHDALARVGYAMILVWNEDHMAAPESKKELEHIHSLIDRRVDGVILRPTHDAISEMYFDEVYQRGIPIVIVGRELPLTNYDFAGTDDWAGGELAAKHLLALGHRRLGQIAGPSSVSTAKGRRLGFEKAVADFGGSATCLTIEAPGFLGVKPQILRLLQAKPRPTAVFAANDDAAAEIYETAAELGLKVPDDLSVVGFGDLVFAGYMTPPLTTLKQYSYAIGEEAAGLMLARCSGFIKGAPHAKAKKIKLLPTLVERGSTRAYP
jgi:LacI family transcriptional regulator